MIRFTTALLGALTLVTPLAQAAPPAKPRPPATVAPRSTASASPRTAASGSPRPGPSGASPNSSSAAFDLGVWTVHASSIDANFKNGDFSTPAKVVMTRVGGDVSADKANGNYKKQVLFLNGHVVMHDSQGGGAGALAGSDAQASPQGPSTLSADQAQIDGAAKLYKAIGNVHYVQADTVVDAATGTLNDTNHSLLLQGNVHIVQGPRSMTAGKVLYNTVTGKAHAEGDVTMQFPGEMHRHLATPKPLKLPKNGLTQPVSAPASPP